jgi:hypothetical protein
MNGFEKPSLQLRPIVSPTKNISIDQVLKEQESEDFNKEFKTYARSNVYTTKVIRQRQVGNNNLILYRLIKKIMIQHLTIV